MSSRRGVSRFPAERSSVRRPVRRFSALTVVAALAAGAVGAAGAGASQQPGCRRSAPKAWSVARVWDEALLDAIRRDTAPPTVVARNLFSLSAAMWDSWSAFHPGTAGTTSTSTIGPGTRRLRRRRH